MRQQWRPGRLSQAGYLWAPIAIVATMIAVAVLLPAVHDRMERPGAVGIAAATWAAVIYCSVPETGPLPPLLAMVFVLTAWELLSRTSLPSHVHFAEVFLITSLGTFGTAGRPSALLGTLFGIWPLVLVAAASVRRLDPHIHSRYLEGVGVIGCVGSLVVARTGALAAHGTVAPLISMAIVAGVSIATVLITRRTQRRLV